MRGPDQASGTGPLPGALTVNDKSSFYVKYKTLVTKLWMPTQKLLGNFLILKILPERGQQGQAGGRGERKEEGGRWVAGLL